MNVDKFEIDQKEIPKDVVNMPSLNACRLIIWEDRLQVQQNPLRTRPALEKRAIEGLGP